MRGRQESNRARRAFLFCSFPEATLLEIDRRRLIPTSVKLEVWKRDGGKCVVCGATNELHFDHIIPFSKGGTSLKADNVQLLCARHNLEKRDKIE
jgi:5-methylcytosine-specific restriction endonuclease McrA